MYAGHVAVALAARRFVRTPLWVLVLAAQGPDWGDAAAELSGGTVARESAWSPHGLLPVALGAVLAAVVAARTSGRGWRARGALVAAACYASHWLCDLCTGYKPTWPGGPIVGYGLFDRPRLDFALEVIVVLAGWVVWRGSLPGRDAGAAGGGPGDGRTRRRRLVLQVGLLAALLAVQVVADWLLGRGGKVLG